MFFGHLFDGSLVKMVNSVWLTVDYEIFAKIVS